MTVRFYTRRIYTYCICAGHASTCSGGVWGVLGLHRSCCSRVCIPHHTPRCGSRTGGHDLVLVMWYACVMHVSRVISVFWWNDVPGHNGNWYDVLHTLWCGFCIGARQTRVFVLYMGRPMTARFLQPLYDCMITGVFFWTTCLVAEWILHLPVPNIRAHGVTCTCRSVVSYSLPNQI